MYISFIKVRSFHVRISIILFNQTFVNVWTFVNEMKASYRCIRRLNKFINALDTWNRSVENWDKNAVWIIQAITIINISQLMRPHCPARFKIIHKIFEQDFDMFQPLSNKFVLQRVNYFKSQIISDFLFWTAYVRMNPTTKTNKKINSNSNNKNVRGTL